MADRRDALLRQSPCTTSVWGATGDHVQISISGVPFRKRQSDRKEDIILNEPIIFYKQVEDSLVLYTQYQVVIPNDFVSKIKIVQIKIRNYDEMENLKVNYHKSGLELISVYK